MYVYMEEGRREGKKRRGEERSTMCIIVLFLVVMFS